MTISDMTYEKSEEMKQRRLSLIHHALNKIFNIPKYSNFSRNVFCVIAHLGLQLIAKEEGLFTNENKINPELSQEEFEIKIKEFVFKNIK